MSRSKYLNLGFICARCRHFLSIAELFPDGQYPPGYQFDVRCPLCGSMNLFTPADLVLRYAAGCQRRAPVG